MGAQGRWGRARAERACLLKELVDGIEELDEDRLA